jgi:HSP20 family protein
MTTATKQVEEAAGTQTAPLEVERDYIRPTVNIYENQEGYVLEAELPGVNKDGVSVSLEGNLLTLEGRRNHTAMPESESLYRETRDADFRRVFEVDPTIDGERITARMEQGVLTLTLPKAEAAKPRQITVA